MRAKKEESPQPTFEEALHGLEEIVAKLESGDLSLEEAIELFQRGAALRRVCDEKLGAARAKIRELMQNEAGEVVEQELAWEGDEHEA